MNLSLNFALMYILGCDRSLYIINIYKYITRRTPYTDYTPLF